MEIQEVKSFSSATGLFCTGLILCKYLKIENLSFLNQSSYLQVGVITVAACTVFKFFDKAMSELFGYDPCQNRIQRAIDAGKNIGKVEFIFDLFKENIWNAFNNGFNDLKIRTQDQTLAVQDTAIRKFLQNLSTK